MNKHILVASSLLALALATPGLAAGPNGPSGPRWHAAPAPPVVAVAPATAEEAAILLRLREEEKLARDVYVALQAQWQVRLLGNLADSEQRHFDVLGGRILLFALTDPALPAPGQFTDPALQAAYDAAVAAGQQSYLEALRTGAGVEDMEIRDLQAALEATANPVLRVTYENLLEGSKTHLRVLTSQLQALGETYTPQCMDPVLYEAIVGY